MLRVLGHASRACDGITRRTLLQAGSLALMGAFGAAGLPTARAETRRVRAKKFILIDLFGGPSHIDMFDPKPDAPAEIRGEFSTIATSLPGIRFTEHLPELARRANRMAVIRTVSHRYNSHNPYGVMTGFDLGDDRTDYHAKPTNHPSVPSVCQYLGIGRGTDLPGYIMLPAFPGYSQGLRRAGPYGGYLGTNFDPVFSTCEPKWARKVNGSNTDFYDHKLIPMGEPELPKMEGGLTVDALSHRRSLVNQLDSLHFVNESTNDSSRHRNQAFDLLSSPRAKNAFDLSKEDPKTRDRYGRDLFGSSVLMARRLVESGVSFVTVHTEAAQASGHWDTHDNNFNLLKYVLLPFLDRSLAALMDDLQARGMDDTLVVVTGDMGRAPRVNARAGRDHWPQCGFALYFGAGIRPGTIYGTSDRTGAFPKDHPVSAGDLVATVYDLMGIDHDTMVPDTTKRPTSISHGGSPVHGIML